MTLGLSILLLFMLIVWLVRDPPLSGTHLGSPSQNAELLGQAIETVLSGESSFSKSHLLIDMAKSQARLEKSDDPQRTLKLALKTINEYQRRLRQGTSDVPHILRVAKVQEELGYLDDARDSMSRAFARRSRTLPGDLSDIAATWAEMGDSSKAIATALLIEDSPQFEESEQYPFRAQAIVTIAVIQAKRGRVEEAIRTVESIHDNYIRALGLARIVPFLARQGDMEGAIRITEAIAANPFAAAIAWIDIGKIQSERGQPEAAREALGRALDVAKAIVNDNLYDIDFLPLLVRAWADGGDVDHALSIVNLTRDHRWKDRLLGTSIIPVLLRSGRMEQAILVLNDIGDVREREFALRLITGARADASADLGDVEGAMNALRSMGGSELGPSDLVGVLDRVAVFHTKKGNWEAAHILLHQIVLLDAHSDLDLFRKIGNLQAASGDVAGAIAWARSLNNSYAKSMVILGIVIVRDQSREESPRAPGPRPTSPASPTTPSATGAP